VVQVVQVVLLVVVPFPTVMVVHQVKVLLARVLMALMELEPGIQVVVAVPVAKGLVTLQMVVLVFNTHL